MKSDQWIQEAKAMGNGFGMVSEGLETPLDELPSNEPALIKQYPLVCLPRPKRYTDLVLIRIHSCGPTL